MSTNWTAYERYCWMLRHLERMQNLHSEVSYHTHSASVVDAVTRAVEAAKTDLEAAKVAMNTEILRG